ncbi:MAG TPA: histidine kinase [Candidatus Limnocylindrales bacterium]|nr:histidine kinase [Candidatus Limnocylindrales bacterium]
MTAAGPGQGLAMTVGRLLVLVAGLVLGAVSAAGQAEFGHRPPVIGVADLLAGWSFLVAGTIAWQKRPANRIGPLLVAVGFTWFVGSYGLLGGETVSHLASSFQGFYEPLLAWVVLAYPAGRLDSRVARLVVGAWLVDQFAWSVARLVLERPLSWYGCTTCPETVDAFIANARTLDEIGPVSLAATVVLGVAVIALLVRRFGAAGRAERRRLVPALLGGVAVAASVATTGAIRIGFAPDLFEDRRIVAATYVLDMLVAVAVLVGLLQERLAREAVAELVVGLQGVPRGGDPRRTQAALARALRDPDLVLLLADGSGGYIDADGRPVPEPVPGSPGRVITRLGGEGDEPPVGLLLHDPGLLDDPGLVSAIAASLRLEADNQRLAAEVERQLAEVRASRTRIVAAGDAERRRVERDLHDGAQQRLISLSMELGRLRMAADRAGDAALVGELTTLGTDLEATIGELRELARGILPALLTDAGLGPAVESLAIRAPIPVRARTDLDERLPRDIESTAYFVVAEALANIARHASAQAATVEIGLAASRLRVVVTDDGLGGAELGRGSGLQGLVDRVGALNGTVAIHSPPGRGTRLIAEIPVPA